MKRTLASFLLVLWCAVSMAQSDPTKTVLTVNGEAISGLEYFRRMEFLPGMGRMVGNRFVGTYPGYLAMQQIINERLLLQLAKEKNVYPKPADVQKRLQEELKVKPELLDNLQKVGISKADLERQITVDLAEFNLVTMGVNIADIEVEKFYKDNAARFMIPRRYKLRVIAVPEADKAAVDQALAGGKSFAETAKTFSKAGTAADGGAMGDYIAADMFAEPTRVVLQNTKVGQTTSWIQGDSGNWFRFLVEDVKAEEKVPLDAQLKERIRRQMMIDRGQVRNNMDKMMMDMRRKAVVTVTQPGLSDMIQEWLKSSTIE